MSVSSLRTFQIRHVLELSEPVLPRTWPVAADLRRQDVASRLRRHAGRGDALAIQQQVQQIVGGEEVDSHIVLTADPLVVIDSPSQGSVVQNNTMAIPWEVMHVSGGVAFVQFWLVARYRDDWG